MQATPKSHIHVWLPVFDTLGFGTQRATRGSNTEPAETRASSADSAASKGQRMHLTEQAEMLRVENLKKVFRSGQSDLVLFENLSFRVRKGEMLAIVGESGAG